MVFVYEDAACAELLPLVYFRPVFDLLCGRRTLLGKTRALYPREKLGLLVRPELAGLTREQTRDRPEVAYVGTRPAARIPGRPALFLNGRVIFDRALPVHGPEEVFVNGKEVVAFRCRPGRLLSIPVRTGDAKSWRLPERNILCSIVRHPWDIIAFNEAELVRELRALPSRRAKPGSAFTVIGRPAGLWCARDAMIDPGVVLDLRQGRIVLDEKSQVRAGSIVAGPCYVGRGTVIEGARVRRGCSFGPDCRIGGEVEATVFLGHANKHHEGFIGHSVVGAWVNLGALTTNSDLRNDYDEVRVELGGRKLSTGLRKFGCIIGDHSKTAIGTLINTGACIGIFVNWFKPGLSPGAIADFRWGPNKTWRLTEALETARTVMWRRRVRLSPEYEQLVRRYHAETQKSR